jgi:hypothetical protein
MIPITRLVIVIHNVLSIAGFFLFSAIRTAHKQSEQRSEQKASAREAAMAVMTMATMTAKNHVPQGQDTKQTQHFDVPPFLYRLSGTCIGYSKFKWKNRVRREKYVPLSFFSQSFKIPLTIHPRPFPSGRTFLWAAYFTCFSLPNQETGILVCQDACFSCAFGHYYSHSVHRPVILNLYDGYS